MREYMRKKRLAQKERKEKERKENVPV